ncbi:hypothetical protein R1sor_022006 [Riccia sorocarpa]|uniref:Uncharacterized protein n=1 Tax=Riccia sorocarpa TaxID=122646 RepID=A0ABD3GIL4_9MARC
MVKLASVRTTRLYGPGRNKDIWEDANAFGYLVSVLLMTAGTALLLPGYNPTSGLWLILVGLVGVFVANIHDLYAQLAGFDFRLPLVTLDPQLALIEIAAPLVQCIGAIIYFLGGVLLLRLARGDFDSFDQTVDVAAHANNLIIAAPCFWLLGSIHNAFQVYESAGAQVQVMQKGVTIPFVIGSTFLLVAGVNNAVHWPERAWRPAARVSVSYAIVGAAFLLIGAVVNVVRVIQLQQIEQLGGTAEKLRGGAQEALVHEREREEWRRPLLEADRTTEIEGGSENPYKANVVEAERVV